MSNEKSNETSMILTPRQEHLMRVRDEMAPGEKPAAIVPHTFAEVMTMCQALAAADLAPKALRGKATDMALVIMTGAEVGLPPMASLRLYTTWDGVPRLMAEGVRAIILQSPAIEYFEMATCDDNHATWIGKRRGRPEKSVTWTVERAKKAGLLEKPVWKAYQQDMLNARASMQLGRIIAPDVVAGMVALEEARDGDSIEAQAVEAKPQFVAPPAPQGPPPGVPVHAVGHVGPVGTAQPTQGVPTVTMAPTPAGATVTIESPPKRGPGRPPKSQTPGTDPFRAAREAVDAREAARPTSAASTNSTSPAASSSPSPSAPASTSSAPGSSGPAPTPTDSSSSTDRWGQTIADPTTPADGSSRASSPPATVAPPTASSSNSESSNESSPASSSVADDGFGGEDPEDSQPAPTGDPGLQLIEELKVFLAGCKSQTEMQNGRPPFAQRSAALFRGGDKRFEAAANGKPAGELASMLGKLWAERKAQLPV